MSSERIEVGGFAQALRHWRGQRKMSQGELALAADTTQRHVSFIESGRSVPGRGMVIRLAEALGLPLRERNALLRAAGFLPSYQETHLDDPKLAPVRRALERILAGHQPYPAVIVDRHGDLIAANEAFSTLASSAAPDLLRQPVNVPRLLLHPSGLGSHIINLDVWSWHIVDALSREQGRHPSERRATLIAELTAMIPPRPSGSSDDYLGLAVPLLLRSRHGELQLLTTLTHFGTADDVTLGELRLEAFLPGDEQTAMALARVGRERERRML